MLRNKILIRLSFIIIASIFLIVNLPAQTAESGGGVFFNVLNYGAKKDGTTKDTKAIKDAIDAAAAQGGGTIYFPPGTYLTGPIHFKSNITIFIDAGAVIKFSTDYDDYLPMVKSRWEGTVNMNFSPLFYGYKVENIAIIGRGTIDGQGQKWWKFEEKVRNEYDKTGKVKENTKWQEMHRKLNAGVDDPGTWNWKSAHFLRPPFIQPFMCSNILIQGITIKNSPFWNITPTFCKNVTVDGVTIESPADSPNTDGIDPSSCSQVRIANCFINVGDDCIAIKSGRDADGRKYGVPSEDITITNCTMLNGHGGVVIGSEMSGGVKRVTISNCVFDGTDRGIRIKTMRGRGASVEGVRVDNIVMRHIKREAFMVNMEYKKSEPEPLSDRTPALKDFHYSNITVESAKTAGFILGLDERHANNITFDDININADNGFTIKKADDIEFHNVRVNCKKGNPFFADGASGLTFDGVKTMTPAENVPMIRLKNVTGALIENCNPVRGTGTFLKVEGKNTKDVYGQTNYLKNAMKKVELDPDVLVNAVDIK